MTGATPELWIREAVADQSWPESRFRILSSAAAAAVCRAVRSAFVSEPCGDWWWTSLREETDSARFVGAASVGYRHITEVVPPASPPLWFIAEGQPAFVVCEGRIEDICSVIGECPGFEYYVVSPRLAWLLCENHHDVLIAVGTEVRGRLVELAARHPELFR